MQKLVPVGIDEFSEIIEGGYYYVDKSMLIWELLMNRHKASLILRPRRFGKSLNMSMLKEFFELGSDKDLFLGLEISNEKLLCEEWQGQRPVVFLSFKDIDEGSYEDALAKLAIVVCDEASRVGVGKGCSGLNDDESAVFARMSSQQASKIDIARSIKLITKALCLQHGKRAIVLIDEYDAPLDKAYISGFYSGMISAYRSMLNEALKGNPY